MKRIMILFFLTVLIILTGCQNDTSNDQHITEEHAKEIIIDERTRECCEDAEVVSITSESNKYIIEWEIESIQEAGTDSIDKKTGKIKTIQSSRGSCKFK